MEGSLRIKKKVRRGKYCNIYNKEVLRKRNPDGKGGAICCKWQVLHQFHHPQEKRLVREIFGTGKGGARDWKTLDKKKTLLSMVNDYWEGRHK